jgi:hypothetical protein
MVAVVFFHTSLVELREPAAVQLISVVRLTLLTTGWLFQAVAAVAVMSISEGMVVDLLDRAEFLFHPFPTQVDKAVHKAPAVLRE